MARRRRAKSKKRTAPPLLALRSTSTALRRRLRLSCAVTLSDQIVKKSGFVALAPTKRWENFMLGEIGLLKFLRSRSEALETQVCQWYFGHPKK